MPGRPLSAEERALWARVTATVRALENEVQLPNTVRAELVEALSLPSTSEARTAPLDAACGVAQDRLRPAQGKRDKAGSDTLDGSWDKRLQRGLAAPERTIDLHGHSLAGAHAALDDALARAVADDVRVLLVVTGRPPRGGDPAGPRRGLIRAAIGDWLGSSRHADRIAAVRHAHPRHGGAGALYLVLRRRRGPARGG